MSELLEYTKKIDKNREEIENLGQLLDNTKKWQKSRKKNEKNYFWLRIVWSEKWANF